jgi:hypothetical protein
VWNDWRSALIIVGPDTVIAWHRKSFVRFRQACVRRSVRDGWSVQLPEK